MIRSAVLNCKAYQCLCFRNIGSTILLQIILQLQVSIKTQFILCQTLSETRKTSFLVMHLLVEFHKNYNCFLPFTVPVIHKVPLDVIPRYPPKGLSAYRVLLQYPHSRTPPFRPVLLLVVGVVGVVNIVINFLPVASEMMKLLILLAVPAVLAVILLVLPAVLAVLLLVLLVLLTSRSF